MAFDEALERRGVPLVGNGDPSTGALSGRGRFHFARIDWSKDPLLKNGHALIASSLITSLLGMGFWVLAARRYDPAVVGRNSVALNALLLAGNVAQLGLSTSFMRFVPVAGKRTLRLVATCYLLCAAVAVGCAIAMFYVLPHIIPSLSFLTASPSLMVWWIVATAAWTTFVIEDGVLTGLRQTRWVPVENAGFSVAKAALVLPLALFLPKMGIFFAWSLATLITIIPTNVFLFGNAIPRAQKEAADSKLVVGQLVRYVPYDYLSSIFWAFSVAAVPVLVIRREGAAQSAYFNLAWVMSYVLYLSAINIGSSLIVESSLDQSRLAAESRRVMAHLSKLIVPAVIVILLGAPQLLDLFGQNYASRGALTFRLLALSALPFIFNETVLSALRAQRRAREFLAIEAAICLLAVLLSWILLDHMGIAGAGAGWLIAQGLVALVLWSRRRSLIGDPTPQPLGPLGAMWLRLSSPLRLRLDAIGLWPSESPSRKDEHLARSTLSSLLKVPVAPAGSRRAHSSLHRVKVDSASSGSISTVISRKGAPIALANIARDDGAVSSLEHDRDARVLVRSLEGDVAVKPAVSDLTLSAVAGRLVSIETMPEGVFADQLLAAAPWSATRLTNMAMDAITSLHEASTTVLDLDDTTADELLASALHRLSNLHPFKRLPEASRSSICRLDEMLRLSFVGRRLSMGMVHGAFATDAFCCSPTDFHVTRITNWHNARELDLCSVDLLSLALDVTSRTTDHGVGVLVAEALRDETYPPGPAFAIAARRLRNIEVAPRDLLLWSWLAYVSGQLQVLGFGHKAAAYWTTNVAPVLWSLRP